MSVKLWIDSVSPEIKNEWSGSYCDHLAKDIAILKNRPLVDVIKCNGCISSPYDHQYGRCRTCIKHTKYERQKNILYKR